MRALITNPFHLVEFSPWPLTGSLGGLCLTCGLGAWFHGNPPFLLALGLLITLVTMVQWWRDVVREGTYQGYHNSVTVSGLQIGMVLFIVSEVCFFFAFFWAFFHGSLAPSVDIGSRWPPAGVDPLSPWGVPLLNTVVLLSSGVTVTWAHHALLVGDRVEATFGLILTIVLGAYFTFLQASEYSEARFCIRDGAYGTIFFVATGFHGLHVLIGTSFLVVCLCRQYAHHYTWSHHFGFEAAAWYWHFVDVVWLFLFVSIYWWGR